jgi:hypothetical protein
MNCGCSWLSRRWVGHEVAAPPKFLYHMICEACGAEWSEAIYWDPPREPYPYHLCYNNLFHPASNG